MLEFAVVFAVVEGVRGGAEWESGSKANWWREEGLGFWCWLLLVFLGWRRGSEVLVDWHDCRVGA